MLQKKTSELTSEKKSNQLGVLMLCFFLTPLLGLGFDLYTPSLPAITHYFNVSYYAANLTIIFYIGGFGIAQPIMGIISDHFQRKLFLLTVLAVYSLSSVLSAWSSTIGVLYCYRIIHSICASGISIALKSILVDHFTGKKLAKANNYFILGWSLTPMLAPIIGGYLQHYYGWQFNFYFMGIYGFIGLIACLFFLEKNSNYQHRKILSVFSVIQKWKTLFSDNLFVSSVFILAVENAILFIYYTSAPFIIQESLHYTAYQYGQMMLFAGASYVVGSLLNDRLLNYFDAKRLIRLGLISSFIIMLVAIFIIKFFENAHMHIDMITVPIFLVFMCDGLIFSNVMTHVLAQYAQFSGTASGMLIGLLNMLAAVIVAFCAHWFDLHRIITIDWIYLILTVLSLFVFTAKFAGVENKMQ